MIGILDIGTGNFGSIGRALERLGAESRRLTRVSDIEAASALVIPGVGHYGMTADLNGVWRGAVQASCQQGRPLLGICLGMQFLFEGSDEAPTPGLGMFTGICRLLPGPAKVPHVGWNALDITPAAAPSLLLAGVADGTHMYFTHSFAAPVTDVCTARTRHDIPFAAAVEGGSIFGTQFHPEKSGSAGLRVLRNFLDLC